MKRIVLLSSVFAVAFPLFGAISGGFGIDAFNRAVGASTRGNAVFSPVSFEFDSVVFSEAFGALTRARFAETMGVLNGLESVYRPLYDNLSQSTGGISFVTARAFCLPDERKANRTYRQWMQTAFSAEAFTFAFKKGADCWFHARLDGDMEGFTLPNEAAIDGHYSYYDLVSIRTPWRQPFPTNGTRKVVFHLADGKTTSLEAMSDRRIVDSWKCKQYTILRLPMADNAWFFALLPDEGVGVRDIRGELNSNTLLNILAGFRSVTEASIVHSMSTVVIPKMDIETESDLKQPFGYFRLPLTDMERMEPNIKPKFLRQRVRYVLDERGVDAKTNDEPLVDGYAYALSEAREFVLNRPFVFFVFHEPTVTVPVAGVFMGK